jgi:hypothetical protein
MIHAFSEIKFPNGHRTTRVFRWYGVGSDLISLIGYAIGNGGTVVVRPATAEEVAVSELRRDQRAAPRGDAGAIARLTDG